MNFFKNQNGKFLLKNLYKVFNALIKRKFSVKIFSNLKIGSVKNEGNIRNKKII